MKDLSPTLASMCLIALLTVLAIACGKSDKPSNQSVKPPAPVVTELYARDLRSINDVPLEQQRVVFEP